MLNPKITIGIVTYNREKYLEEAINSALSQSSLVHEILVVDDCSTDNTQHLLARTQHPKFRWQRLSKNSGGRSGSRNALIQAMTGDYLVWLDDDDVFIGNGVQTLIDTLRSNQSADVIYGNHLHTDPELNPLRTVQYPSLANNQMLMHMVFENVVPQAGTLIRKTLFERVGFYDETYPRFVDYNLWVRALIAGATFVHHGQCIYKLRQHNNNSSNPQETKDHSMLQCRILKYLLANTTLEKIFPVFNWQDKPQESVAEALQIIAKVFFDHGDDPAALDCLDTALGYSDNVKITMLRGYVLRSLKRYEEAANQFSNSLATLYPEIQSFNIEIGSPRGSLKVAAEKNANTWR